MLESSQLLGSVLGVLLLFRRARPDAPSGAAWWLALGLVVANLLLSLAKGLAFVEVEQIIDARERRRELRKLQRYRARIAAVERLPVDALQIRDSLRDALLQRVETRLVVFEARSIDAR